MDVHLAARLHRLVASGFSIRAAARELGVSRSAAMRAVANPPVIELADEFDGNDDPWTDDGEELPLALLADDDTEPHDVLTPPFVFAGLVEMADHMPTRRRDGKARQAPQWTDADGHLFGELDLYRWGAWQECQVGGTDDYPSRDAYLAAWDAATALRDTETDRAWDSLRAAGVYHDDERRLWLKRPRAV
jgi:hypothetical protein